MNRGLHYYTGLMFEIHCPNADGEAIQLCGGGRYDNLISILGGAQPVPAAGFAFGVERIARLLHSETDQAQRRPDVYLIPIAEADRAAGYQIADALRRRDVVVEVSIDDRSLRRSVKHAVRLGAALVIIIGEDERDREAAIVRAMGAHQEWSVAFDELPHRVEELLKAYD